MTKKRDPLGRAFDVLRFLAEAPGQYQDVSHIALSLESQQSTISRLLSTLRETGTVEREGSNGGYRVGWEIIRIANLATAKLDYVDIASPLIQELSAEFNETAFFALYSSERRQMIRISTAATTQPLRYFVAMNEWTEIFRGASGLAILAFLPQEERSAIVETAHSFASEREPWLDRDKLESFLAEVRDLGFAKTQGRRIAGAVGIAAPVFDSRGRVIGDVIMTSPEERAPLATQDRIAEAVCSAAAKLSARITGSGQSQETTTMQGRSQ